MDLFVNRIGKTKNSFMTTKSLVCTFKSFSNVVYLDDSNEYKKIMSINKNVSLNGTLKNITDDKSDNNILGVNHIYEMFKSNIDVPLSSNTKEILDLYDIKLIESGEQFNLYNISEISMYEMSIGNTYYEDYILQKDLGNGLYLEKHDLPHFYYCNDDEPKGVLLIGKEINNSINLTAFKIPKNKGIYISPYVYHCDALLVGNYHVIYGKSENYLTMLLKTKDGNNVKINVL